MRLRSAFSTTALGTLGSLILATALWAQERGHLGPWRGRDRSLASVPTAARTNAGSRPG